MVENLIGVGLKAAEMGIMDKQRGAKTRVSFPPLHHLFVVDGALIALTQNLERRILETGMNGGICVKIPTRSTRLNSSWFTLTRLGQLNSSTGLPRLERVFIDEAHKIVIDSDFLSCFKRFPNLAPPSVPITFLSGSLMLRSMPVILEAMEINDAAVVDEIYRCSGRRNLKYVVERTVQEGYLENILQLVQRENERAGEQGWRIIFLSTLKEARAGEEQLTELNNILESVILNGCLDCWVKGGFHADGTVYNRFWDFTSTVVALKGICTGPSAFWPFCYDCWDPFRWACNRLPSIPKKPHGPGRHIHRVAEEASGEFAPDILIALIFTYKDSLQRSVFSYRESSSN
ncbi:hypothetical protein HHX47_DHR4000578 [Lentinula edodes]|nr:hypothetical protein HHX47_DHR4000578 [Lentinula edodes]